MRAWIVVAAALVGGALALWWFPRRVRATVTVGDAVLFRRLPTSEPPGTTGPHYVDADAPRETPPSPPPGPPATEPPAYQW